MVGRIGLDERELQLFLQARDVSRVGREVRQLGVVAGGLEVFLRATPLLREPVRALSSFSRRPMSAACLWSL